MNINDYIEYWDRVIDEWLGKKSPSVDYKKEYDVWLDGNSKVSQEDMPEPYWGYPQKGSLVVLNYNPAGGFEGIPMTTKSYANCSSRTTFINYVYRHCYSGIAKSFPLIYDDGNEEINKALDGYVGADWWRKKKEWMESWTKNDARPFVMELCGWHSKNWKDTKFEKVINKPEALQHIQDTVVAPLIHAVKRSGNMAVCIGKQFGMLLSKLGFCEVTAVLRLSTGEYVSDKGWQPCEKKRYYRVFTKDGIYVVNTWSVGGNRHPAKAYAAFEEELRKIIFSKLECPVSKV